MTETFKNAALTHRPVTLAIVGGGAAGLFAAATAVSRGVGCFIVATGSYNLTLAFATARLAVESIAARQVPARPQTRGFVV